MPFRRPRPSTKPSASLELGDEALLAACAVGDSGALAALYDRHHQVLFRFISRLACGPRSDVEDLVQCTFIEVWKSAGRYRERGSARSWMFGISANLTKHYIRSESRRRHAMDGLAEVPESVGGASAPDHALTRAQRLAHLQVAMSALTHQQRAAFVLCDIEGISGVEAARILGLRQGTLWRRLHDARKRLRQSMPEEELL